MITFLLTGSTSSTSTCWYVTFILLFIYSLTECSVCAGGPATITTNCCNRSYCKPCLKQAFNLRKAINALDGTNKKLLQELNTLGYEDYYAFQAVKKGYDVFEAMEWLNELDDDEYLKIQHSLFCPVCWKPLEG